MSKNQTSVGIPKDVHEMLKQISAQEKIPMSQVLRLILREYLKNKQTLSL